MKPLCFVIMPFGLKKDASGDLVDFDEIYTKLINPAIVEADMEPIRADEETVNGIIHKPMYERLILCDYAIADLTTANANVFYELGIRHAVKPYTTLTIFAKGTTLPFDVSDLRCMPYGYSIKDKLTEAEQNKATLVGKLKAAKLNKATDSPVYQLVDGISFQNSVAHQKTDIFREQVTYNKEIKDKLTAIRGLKTEKSEIVKALDAFVDSTIKVEDEETGVLIDIMLTYRAISSQESLQKMVAFINSLPLHVKNTVMVQEQLGFALNRINEKEKAIEVLNDVIAQNGPSSETYGILGRVYKDKYDNALQSGNELLAEASLDNAIEMYGKGFEADWRDAYPGINLISLLEIKGDREMITRIAPVVTYSVQRKIQSKTPDYWDYATLLEIAVIAGDEVAATANLLKAIGCPFEANWMLDTTINNLTLITNAREKRNEDTAFIKKMISQLESQKRSI